MFRVKLLIHNFILLGLLSCAGPEIETAPPSVAREFGDVDYIPAVIDALTAGELAAGIESSVCKILSHLRPRFQASFARKDQSTYGIKREEVEFCSFLGDDGEQKVASLKLVRPVELTCFYQGVEKKIEVDWKALFSNPSSPYLQSTVEMNGNALRCNVLLGKNGKTKNAICQSKNNGELPHRILPNQKIGCSVDSLRPMEQQFLVSAGEVCDLTENSCLQELNKKVDSVLVKYPIRIDLFSDKKKNIVKISALKDRLVFHNLFARLLSYRLRPIVQFTYRIEKNGFNLAEFEPELNLALIQFFKEEMPFLKRHFINYIAPLDGLPELVNLGLLKKELFLFNSVEFHLKLLSFSEKNNGVSDLAMVREDCVDEQPCLLSIKGNSLSYDIKNKLCRYQSRLSQSHPLVSGLVIDYSLLSNLDVWDIFENSIAEGSLNFSFCDEKISNSSELELFIDSPFQGN